MTFKYHQIGAPRVDGPSLSVGLVGGRVDLSNLSAPGRAACLRTGRLCAPTPGAAVPGPAAPSNPRIQQRAFVLAIKKGEKEGKLYQRRVSEFLRTGGKYFSLQADWKTVRM